MLTVHLLGHAHVTYNDRPVPLSAKAVALIAYLAIEKLPQHRERLADLLWNTAEARKNLRVELARIRAAGLDIFPLSRQLLYLEHVTTDLEVWQSRLGGEMDQTQLAGWLAMLRGLPLSGLEDLGSAAFHEWVDHQRWVLAEQIEGLLGRAHARFQRDGKTWATRAIAARAEALGLECPPHGDPGPEPARPRPAPGPLHFEDHGQEVALREALTRAAQCPQLAVLYGPMGSGKTYLAERALGGGEWLSIRISNSRISRLVLASLAQGLLPAAEGPAAETLRGVLLQPAGLEEDVVRVATVMSGLGRPVAVVLDHAHNAPVELASLLEFLFHTPAPASRALLLLSRTPPAHSPLCRALLRRFGRSQALALELTPLSLGSVERALQARGAVGGHLLARAAQVLQRSEGNVLHLLGLLEQPAQDPEGPGGRLPDAVRETYAGEIDGWPAPLRRALSSLSVIQGDFTLALAQAALDGAGHGAPALPLLREALERRALIEAEPPSPLGMPAFEPLEAALPSAPCYRFRAEGLRVTLAGSLTHAERQEVRRHLARALEASEPGLALYYAERAGADVETERLRRAYHARLPEGSPLRLPPRANGAARPRTPAAGPRSTGVPGSASFTWQGYLLSWAPGGWLGVVSQGRYGHPHTLRLHLPLPKDVEAAHRLELRLVWRLDVYRPGDELGPLQVPFPLRLGLLGAGEARVLTPQELGDHVEAGCRHRVHSDVAVGGWMEHHLTLPPGHLGVSTLELGVRALDVALTVAELSVNGRPLLPLAHRPEAVTTPEWAEPTPAEITAAGGRTVGETP